LLELIQSSGVELVLSGHVHHFFYNRLNNTDLFTLPSTSFTRQDFSDMFKQGPAPEFGRNDAQKFVVTMIDVYPDKCRLRLIDTDGREASDNEAIQVPSSATSQSEKPLTVSLRHAWHESIDLPYNGPMEEFTRKRVRNDYSLLRLMQMGIRQLRIPIQELLEPSSRQRILDCANLGFRFHIVCLQNAWGNIHDATSGMGNVIASIEYVLPNDGFSINELHTVFTWLEQRTSDISIDGIVVQLPWESPLVSTLEKLGAQFSSQSYSAVVNVRLAKSNPAEENTAEKAIGNRIIDAMTAARSLGDMEIQLDTFMSLDRGYSPRLGLVDRLGNLTAPGRQLARS